MPILRLCAVLLALLSPAAAAVADDALAYLLPNHARLAETAMRLGVINADDEAELTEYARMAHCDLYRGFHDNEFEWTKVIAALRQSIAQNLRDYPLRYAVVGRVELGRYDFEIGGFRLPPKSRLENVGYLPLLDSRADLCDGFDYQRLKQRYRAVLQRPVTIWRIPMRAEDAEALRQRLLERGFERAQVVVRFNLSIIRARPDLGTGPDDPIVYLSAFPDSVEIFEDESLENRLAVFLGEEQRQTPP